MNDFKHIFIEGKIQAGKSTVIRECMAPYKNVIGGISCKRYIDEYGVPKAYGLAVPKDLNLNGRYSQDLHGNPERGVLPKDPSIFMVHQSGKPYIDTSVFDLLGVEMLKSSRNNRLVLLDEIGGIELLSESFRRELYYILEGDYHCIGVIKQIDINRPFRFRDELSVKRDNYNYRLREDLVQKFQSKIIKYEAGNEEIIKEEIKEFLKRSKGF